MKRHLYLLFASLLACSVATAAERKPITDVSIDDFTSQTQAAFKNAGDEHFAMAWWIPKEFWASVLKRDPNMSETDRREMLKALSGVSLLAVVQADISRFGAFKFYAQSAIEEHLQITFKDGDGKARKLAPEQSISPDLEIILGVLKPILTAAMGNLGNNLHFFVLDDAANGADRLIDPYLPGELQTVVERKGGQSLQATLELPLDALYIPRTCPNGKPAHISWKFCPWSGKKLPK